VGPDVLPCRETVRGRPPHRQPQRLDRLAGLSDFRDPEVALGAFWRAGGVVVPDVGGVIP